MAGTYNRKDHFYERAKQEGFASRAAYKLKELQSKHRLIKQGYSVLDLGAWPGGWCEVAAKLTGPSGVVVGIDFVQIEISLPKYVHFLKGDVGDENILAQAVELAGGHFNAVISDMSPKLTGIREVDALATTGCGELALFVAEKLLLPGGSLAVKLFKSAEADLFVKSARPLFNKLVRNELSSTRRTSNEFYMVGLGFRGSRVE